MKGKSFNKYMRAFEDFDVSKARPEPEETDQPKWGAIWLAIDSGDPFGIISAYSAGNDPDVMEQDHSRLMKDVLKLKYGYLEQSYGYQYTDDRNSLITVSRKSLFVPLIPYNELLDLGRKYRQETISFGGKGGLDVVRVDDESVVMSMKADDMRLAFNLFLCNLRLVPWK